MTWLNATTRSKFNLAQRNANKLIQIKNKPISHRLSRNYYEQLY